MKEVEVYETGTIKYSYCPFNDIREECNPYCPHFNYVASKSGRSYGEIIITCSGSPVTLKVKES